MLILFNYNTLTDLIPSSFFVYSKSHSVFQTFSSSSFLSASLMLIIYLFTTLSFRFLATLTQFSNYKYLGLVFISEAIISVVVLFLFFTLPLYIYSTALILYFLLNQRLHLRVRT